MSGQRKALIVANDEYEQEGLRHLVAPAVDAAALASVLGNPEIGDFAVQVVYNEPSHIIGGRIEDFLAEGHPNDVLLLHFSCHGLKNESGKLFLAARNTRLNRLGSTAIAADFVDGCLRASRSRCIVLLLDCCYGGAFSQGVTVRAAEDVNVLDAFPGTKSGGGRGRAVITASGAMEYAFEGEHLADDHTQRPSPSVFTKALVDGLATGDADLDEDGWVSLDELYDYVFDKVRERNPHQTPSRDIKMQGDLYVAHSRRKRIRAAPFPPDLEAARKDPNMYTRRGAVDELRSRLLGDNLPAAAGAWEALIELANDVKYVADEARAALHEAAVRPAETELNFGRLVQGSSAPPRMVHLLGPPIARACKPDVSHKWFRVKETAEGYEISIDTAQPGTLNGRLKIKGPTGEAAVTIQAEISAPASAPAEKPSATDMADAKKSSAKLRIIGGVSVGIVLIGVLIAVLVPGLRSTPSAAPTPSPRFSFSDSLSKAANDWTVLGLGSSGRYSNGKYHIYEGPGTNNWATAVPLAAGLDSAPLNIAIEVSARPIVGIAYLHYGILCRSDYSGRSGYEFQISQGLAQIVKWVNGQPTPLTPSVPTTPPGNGANQLRATCTRAGNQDAVHLAFWVNGKKLDDVTDRTNPIASGTVGLTAEKASGATGAVEVEYGNFVVTQA